MIDLFGNEVIEDVEDIIVSRTKKNLFGDLLPDLLIHKKNILKNEPEASSDYQPWIINKAMSQYMDCILFANEMNKASSLPKNLQYDYYIHSIRKGKRFGWQKRVDIDNLEIVMKHYNMSEAKAVVSLKLLSDEDIDNIKKLYEKGGKE